VLNSIGQNQARGLMKGEYLVSARDAHFFGAPLSGTFLGSTDLTTKIVTVFLIVFMSATTFTTQRQLMVKGMPKMDSTNNLMLQQQKIMLYLFPIIFAVTGVNFPIGVLIYWSTTNLWTWGQQYYVIKRNPTPGSPAYEELQRKRAAKGLIDEKGLNLGGANSSGGVATAENQQSGQRKQPKRKKKRS
jgi:YidC/Oxa1 family membrane protein insertase